VPGPGARLKNGVQMMESEGVIATLFYRLVNDARLREAYREPAFYEPFLDETEVASLRSAGPRTVVSPIENVYLKLFEVMHRSFAWGDWPAIGLVQGYASRFPAEAGAIYDVFLDVTRGVTVAREASTRHGEPGYLAGLRERLLAGTAKLDDTIGRAIWLRSPSMVFGLGVYRYFLLPSSFTFDLNAADIPDLLSVPGISPRMAAAIVEARDARGAFASVEDLSTVPGMTPELLVRLTSKAAKMREQMGRSGPRSADPGWFKTIMVPLLRASYYAAALWQLGSAVVMAGLVFGLTNWIATAAGRASRPTDAGQASRLSVGQASRLSVALAWLRRRARALARGSAVAILPCAASVALYAAGVLPTAWNMTLVGLSLGALYVADRALWRTLPTPAMPFVLRSLVALTATSAAIGLMY
jgi:hypothetical protein